VHSRPKKAGSEWSCLTLLCRSLERRLRISDGTNTAFIDLGWDEPMVGIDYDGDQHLNSRRRYVRDIGRYDMIDRRGYTPSLTPWS
jgi:hypothetical protein